MTRRTALIGVREVRAANRFEVRATTDATVVLEGYASTFEPYDMFGGPAGGGWIEQLAPSAFDVTLREKPDLHLLINHEGMPLARTKSGTLDLSVDSHGLRVRATLDRSDPDVQRLEAKMRRGDMDEMSFAFRVNAQTWRAAEGFENDPQSHRLITEVSLHKGDVSVVNFGANPTTSAEITGKRRKGKMSGKRTLSVAEASAVVLVDAKKYARSRSAAAAADVVAADSAAQRARDAGADLLLDRAQRILETFGTRAKQLAVSVEIPSGTPRALRDMMVAEAQRRAAADEKIRAAQRRQAVAEMVFGGRPSIALKRS